MPRQRVCCSAQVLNSCSLALVPDFASDSVSAASDSVSAAQVLTGERVYEILRRISDDDCRLIGLDPQWSRPDWMMLTVVPVPPPHVRPAVDMDSMGRCEDDLTHKLAEIIRGNHALKQQMDQAAAEHVLKVRARWFLCRLD